MWTSIQYSVYSMLIDINITINFAFFTGQNLVDEDDLQYIETLINETGSDVNSLTSEINYSSYTHGMKLIFTTNQFLLVQV